MLCWHACALVSREQAESRLIRFPTLTRCSSLLWSQRTVPPEGESFGWGDQAVPTVAHDVTDHPVPRLSLHRPPSAPGQLSSTSPLHLCWTSFSPAIQGTVSIPPVAPWNKTLSLLVATGPPPVLAQQPCMLPGCSQCTLIPAGLHSCWPLHLMVSSIQHFVSPWWPALCQAVSPGWSWALWGCFLSKEPRRLPAPVAGGELSSDGHHPHTAEAPAAPPNKAWWKHPNLSLSAGWV